MSAPREFWSAVNCPGLAGDLECEVDGKIGAKVSWRLREKMSKLLPSRFPFPTPPPGPVKMLQFRGDPCL